MRSEAAVTKKQSEDLTGYLEAPYVRMLVPDSEDGGFIAEVLELPGCVSSGDTAEDAYRNLQEAMSGWIRASLSNGKPIPEPVGEKEFSGHFALRMPSEVHRGSAIHAMQAGISLNQWILNGMISQLTAEDLAAKIADQVVRQLSTTIQVEAFAGLRVTLQQTMTSPAEPSATRDPYGGLLLSPTILSMQGSSLRPERELLELSRETSHG